MNISRIVLVTRQSRYEELLKRHGTHGNAAFLLASRDEHIDEYVAWHERYWDSVHQVEEAIPRDVAWSHVVHTDVPRFHFRPRDVVIAVGPDGLFANIAKYLSGQPVIAVNPDRSQVDGVVMRHDPQRMHAVLTGVLEGDVAYDEVALAEATTPEGGRILAVNDFLIGRRDHVSARYVIDHAGRAESQSSSGIIVSTGMGASGWLRSVRTAVEAGLGRRAVRIPENPAWEERRLVFAVREPFPTKGTGVSLVYGSVTDSMPLTITSEMPEGGVVFSDGVPQDALQLPAGIRLTVRIAPERVLLVR